MEPAGTEVPVLGLKRQRCVVLARGSSGPSGGANLPTDLMDALTSREMDVRRCDSAYLAMAELVLHETARRAGWHRDSAVLLIVEPETVPNLDDLTQAAMRWTTRTVFWRYTTGENPRLAALPVETAPIDAEENEEVNEPKPAMPKTAKPRLRLASEAEGPARTANVEAPRQRTKPGVEPVLRLDSDDETDGTKNENDPLSDTMVLSEAELSMLLSSEWELGKGDQEKPA